MKRILLLLALLLAPSAFASLQVQTGQFAASTGGTTTTVNCNFTGKAIILWTHGKTSNTESATAVFSMGFSDGTNLQDIAWAADDAVSTVNSSMTNSTTRALHVPTTGTPTINVADTLSGVTFNSSTFVLTWNGTPTSAWLVNFILLGGTDITNVFVGSTAMPTGAGTLNVTNAGFQGNFVLLAATQQTAVGNSVNSAVAFGAAASSTKRWGFGLGLNDAATTSATVNGMTIMRTDNALVSQNGSNVVSVVADFTQFTATGFDLNFSTAPASAYLLHYIVIKGGQWDVGSGTKPTTATTQTVSGEAFRPALLGMFTSSPTASNSNVSNAVSSFGATDGTNSITGAAFHNDAINTVAKSIGDATHLSIDYDRANNPLASFTSFNSDGWTVTWSATGTAHEVGWFTAASNSGAAPTQASPFVISDLLQHSNISH